MSHEPDGSGITYTRSPGPAPRFARIPESFLEIAELDPYDFVVLVAIQSNGVWVTRQCFMSLSTIMAKSRLSRHTVINSLHKLERLGIIVKERDHCRRTHATRKFRLKFLDDLDGWVPS